MTERQAWPRSDIGQQAETANRRARAIRLRIGGATYPEIAQQLGYSDKAAAYKDVQRALESAREDVTQQAPLLRVLEGERLDRLTLALWPKAMEGDVKAVDAIRRLRESYRRLYGVDEPTEHRVITIDAVDAEIARLEAEMRAREGGDDIRRGPAATPALPA